MCRIPDVTDAGLTSEAGTYMLGTGSAAVAGFAAVDGIPA
jgi:hypothetical protein